MFVPGTLLAVALIGLLIAALSALAAKRSDRFAGVGHAWQRGRLEDAPARGATSPTGCAPGVKPESAGSRGARSVRPGAEHSQPRITVFSSRRRGGTLRRQHHGADAADDHRQPHRARAVRPCPSGVCSRSRASTLRRGRVGDPRRAHRSWRPRGVRAEERRVPQELVAELDQHRRPEVLPRAAGLAHARALGQADGRPRRRARSPTGAASAATSRPSRPATRSRRS